MKKFTKLMMLTLSLGWAAGSMAQDWTFYNPDNTKHRGTDYGSTIYVKERTAPTLADFNNDGKLEMVYGGQNDYDFWWVWKVTGSDEDGNDVWGWDWDWYCKWDNSAYAIGFNGWDNDPVRLDGKEDYWTFETDTYGLPLGTHNFYRWIDFDNDGNLDLIMLAKSDYDYRGLAEGYEHYALIYRNGGAEAGYKFEKVDKAPFNIVDGVPGFNPNNGYFDGNDRMGRNIRGISFGDVNNDGIMDFVCMNYTDQLSVYLGNGDGSFTKFVQLDDAYREGDVKLADLDGDGNLDIVAAAWNGSGLNAVNFYKGNGDGTFILNTPDGVRGQRGGSVAIADFNNDGKLDVFVFGYSDSVGFWVGDLFLNTGDFGFEPAPGYVKYNHNDADWTTCLPYGDDNKMWWADATTAYAFDVDNDGNVDILMAVGTELFLFRGNGDGSFNKNAYCCNKQNGGKSGGGFSFGDIYNRNMLDMAICYKSDDSNSFIATVPGRAGSDGNGALNQAPSVPTNLKAERKGGVITLTWNASTDDKTPSKSLYYNVYVKYGDKVRCLVPAIIESGKLKVVQDMQTLVMGTSYTITLPEDYAKTAVEVGVQAIDGVFAPSAFTTLQLEALEQAIVFDFEANEWDHALGSGTSDDTTTPGNITEPLEKDGVSIVFQQGEGEICPRYWAGPQVRVYQDNLMKFYAPEGKAIVKIEFTAVGTRFGLTAQPASVSEKETVWEGNSADVFFTATKQNRLTKAVVTIADADEQTTTGVSTVKGAQTTTNSYFNLQGQRVDNPTRGLYIVGGRKVVVK